MNSVSPASQKSSPWATIGLLVFFGGAAALYLDSCRHNLAYQGAQVAVADKQNKAVAAKNVTDFMRSAPGPEFIVDCTTDPDNGNALFFHLEKTWDALLLKDQEHHKQVWFATWKRVVDRQPAGDGETTVSFFPPDGSLPDIYGSAPSN